jgi:hypothetical protein
MTDKLPPEDEKPDADAVFAATLKTLANTPHKPHVPVKEKPPARRDQK